MKQEMKTVFKLFDFENKGFITLESLKTVCGVVDGDLDDSTLQEMVMDLDLDGDGMITEEDFMRMLRKTVSVPCKAPWYKI
jgi:Ca2+-binding EF-hand superfamily protein